MSNNEIDIGSRRHRLQLLLLEHVLDERDEGNVDYLEQDRVQGLAQDDPSVVFVFGIEKPTSMTHSALPAAVQRAGRLAM